MSSARSSSIARKTVLEEALRQVGVVGQVGEGDLRLDHPELGQVAAGVGVLRAERRPEGVDAGQRQAVGLDVELARHGQERGLAEEVLRVVDRAVGRARQVGQVQRGDAEQLAGALGVAGRQDRRVHPEEAVLVEVAMDGHGQAVPDAGHRADAVRAHAQVGDLAQVLEGVVLGLDRVAVRVVDPADDIDRVGDQLDVLALALRGDERSADGDCAAGWSGARSRRGSW